MNQGINVKMKSIQILNFILWMMVVALKINRMFNTKNHMSNTSISIQTTGLATMTMTPSLTPSTTPSHFPTSAPSACTCNILFDQYSMTPASIELHDEMRYSFDIQIGVFQGKFGNPDAPFWIGYAP